MLNVEIISNKKLQNKHKKNIKFNIIMKRTRRRFVDGGEKKRKKNIIAFNYKWFVVSGGLCDIG